MPTLLAQIAPQRSTQYSALATALAPHELRLSPLGEHITSDITLIQLANQLYLKFDVDTTLSAEHLRELGSLAATNAFFEYYEQLGEQAGPLLRPISTSFQPAFSPDLAATRRYKGKTSELLTLFLCNIARWSSDFAHEPWSSLRVFDPLCGGGTTLFTALVLGARASGVEKSREDVESTVAFLKHYAREESIACEVKEERLKKFGRRWWFTLGSPALRRDGADHALQSDRLQAPQDAAGSVELSQKQCVIARGETAQSAELMVGVKRPHLIVSDLPYGIQHQGELVGLLEEALPVWASMLLSGGVMTFAWESTRLPRAEMIALVERVSGLHVLNGPSYDQLAHRVDRVIKQRDVIVARTVT